MKALLLALSFALSGCAATPTVVAPRGGADGHAVLGANAGSARTTGSRTQKVGLPLSRGGKIGLWTGVAVFLAYLMATDGEEDGVGTAEP